MDSAFECCPPGGSIYSCTGAHGGGDTSECKQCWLTWAREQARKDSPGDGADEAEYLQRAIDNSDALNAKIDEALGSVLNQDEVNTLCKIANEMGEPMPNELKPCLCLSPMTDALNRLKELCDKAEKSRSSVEHCFEFSRTARSAMPALIAIVENQAKILTLADAFTKQIRADEFAAVEAARRELEEICPQ
jgi:hypothetical protein